MILSGWGRFPEQHCQVAAPRSEADLRALLGKGALIARGNGRAYGDSAYNPRQTVLMHHFNRMLAFDATSGQLTVEAGVILGDVVAAMLPRGWFPPVTPGTKFVTIGGMIAADVHGKNHHKYGTFGGFVDWIDVMQADGTVRRASPSCEPDLFYWTIGGMGLTGVILRAAFRMIPVPSAWIRQTLVPASGLDATMAAFDAAQDVTYSVAWIDCLSSGAAMGRSLLMLGEHASTTDLPPDKAASPYATPRKRKLSVPFDAPGFALNRLTVRAFNALYYRKGVFAAGESLIDWDSYFYPLDAILGWNRIYGRKGFAQFQCALPLPAARDGLRALLQAISASGQGSFLSVIKRFGPQDSRISFPMQGYTLALDFPVTPKTLALLERLDSITLAHGGRFYLAKDSRMRPETLRASDPRMAAFRAQREARNCVGHFVSAQSERLEL